MILCCPLLSFSPQHDSVHGCLAHGCLVLTVDVIVFPSILVLGYVFRTLAFSVIFATEMKLVDSPARILVILTLVKMQEVVKRQGKVHMLVTALLQVIMDLNAK